MAVVSAAAVTLHRHPLLGSDALRHDVVATCRVLAVVNVGGEGDVVAAAGAVRAVGGAREAVAVTRAIRHAAVRGEEGLLLLRLLVSLADAVVAGKSDRREDDDETERNAHDGHHALPGVTGDRPVVCHHTRTIGHCKGKTGGL